MARIVLCLIAVLLIGAHAQTDSTTSNSSSTDEPTTETPITTTETEAPSTTTSTSTSTTSSTTVAPPPSTPSPDTDKYYRVTDGEVTCIMFSGDITFTVEYQRITGENLSTTVKIPQPKDSVDIETKGSCNGTVEGDQFIAITWGPTNGRSSFKLLFNSTGGKWMMINTEANVYIDEKNFVNATDAGKWLNVVGQFPGLSNFAVADNTSLTCRAAVSSTSFTAHVANSSLGYKTTASAVGVELQAFNSIPNSKELQQGTRCEADVTSDMVPIAVGCALAGLVLLVLISYLVGRRRRSAAYQSV